MTRLWLKTPPFLPDTYGMQEVVKQCGGVGLIDDSCEYPVEPRGDWTTGRMISSDARMSDVINGTHKKILEAFCREKLDSTSGFILLCSGPGASMIGTDLNEAAHAIQNKSGIPTAMVNITGHKSYDYGISKSLEALVNLLAEMPEVHDGSINILGINHIDISPTGVSAMHDWMKEVCVACSKKVNLWLGGDSAEDLRRAAEASLNIVVTVSGLSAAKMMQKKFGIPYIAVSPYGSKLCNSISKYIAEGTDLPITEMRPEDKTEVVIIGEQLQSNAIRSALISDYGIKKSVVLSYFLMEKDFMMQGDQKVIIEEQMERAILDSGCQYVIADPALRPLVPESKKFIELPGGQYFWGSGKSERPVLVGEALDQWLKNNFVK